MGEPEKLAFPSDFVMCSDGSFLVTDTNNHRVQRFVPGQAAATTVAGSKAAKSGSSLSELNMPTGICLDPRDGSFLVADRCNARVLRFSANAKAGDSGAIVAGSNLLDRPWGVCASEDGHVYVSDERQAVVLKLGSGVAATENTSAKKSTMAFAPPPRTVPKPPEVQPPPLSENPMELD